MQTNLTQQNQYLNQSQVKITANKKPKGQKKKENETTHLSTFFQQSQKSL